MSSITKTFYSLAGTQYRLSISGSTVTGSESFDLSADPVRLSFAKGKHKFIPLRTWEMKIGVVTSADLSHLYSDTPISTTITLEQNVSGTWKFVFYGFLEPLTYNQPFSGMLDNITLTAVDALTAYAYKYYATAGTGCQWKTGLNYLRAICSEIGVEEIIVAPCASGSTPFQQTYPESAFLTPELEQEATYPDVVSAIVSQSAMTAMVYGKTLYCVGLSTAFNSNTYCAFISVESGTVTPGKFTLNQPDFTLNAATLRDADMQISIEQPYGTVTVKPKGAAKGYYVPPIFAKATAASTGTQITVDDGARAVSYQRLENTGIDFYAYRTDYGMTYTEQDFKNGVILLNDSWYGAVPIRYRWWNTGEDFNGVNTKDAICVLLGHPSRTQGLGYRLFQLKPSYQGTGAVALKISCTVASRNRNDYKYPPILGGDDSDPSMTGAELGPVTIPGLYIKIGTRYYYLKNDTPFIDGQWAAIEYQAPMTFGISTDKGEKKIRPSKTGVYTYYETDWIANLPSAGWNNPIEVFMNTVSPNTGRGFWIFDFKIEYRTYTNFGSGNQSRTTTAQNAADELTADVWFDDQSGSCRGNYPSTTLLNALYNRYSVKHRAIEFTGSVMKPFSTVIDGTNGNTRVAIDSMDWDVRNDKCRVYAS